MSAFDDAGPREIGAAGERHQFPNTPARQRTHAAPCRSTKAAKTSTFSCANRNPAMRRDRHDRRRSTAVASGYRTGQGSMSAGEGERLETRTQRAGLRRPTRIFWNITAHPILRTRRYTRLLCDARLSYRPRTGHRHRAATRPFWIDMQQNNTAVAGGTFHG